MQGVGLWRNVPLDGEGEFVAAGHALDDYVLIFDSGGT